MLSKANGYNLALLHNSFPRLTQFVLFAGFFFCADRAKSNDYKAKACDFGIKAKDFGAKASDFRAKAIDYETKESDFEEKENDFEEKENDFGVKSRYGRQFFFQRCDKSIKNALLLCFWHFARAFFML